jgi:hypothetical protein
MKTIDLENSEELHQLLAVMHHHQFELMMAMDTASRVSIIGTGGLMDIMTMVGAIARLSVQRIDPPQPNCACPFCTASQTLHHIVKVMEYIEHSEDVNCTTPISTAVN